MKPGDRVRVRVAGRCVNAVVVMMVRDGDGDRPLLFELDEPLALTSSNGGMLITPALTIMRSGGAMIEALTGSVVEIVDDDDDDDSSRPESS